MRVQSLFCLLSKCYKEESEINSQEKSGMNFVKERTLKQTSHNQTSYFTFTGF